MISETCPQCGRPFVIRPGTELGLPEWYCPHCDSHLVMANHHERVVDVAERLARLVLFPPPFTSWTDPSYLIVFEYWARQVRVLADELLDLIES